MDFKIADNPVRGNLSPEDLKFFYYDVAKLSELGLLIECSNDKLYEIARDIGIILKPIQQQTFSFNKYIPAENEIIFTFLTNRGKKELLFQTALLRHLRNSFSHYRTIYAEGDRFLKIEDSLYGGHTMKGFVDVEKLKDFIFKQIDYSEEQILLHTK